MWDLIGTVTEKNIKPNMSLTEPDIDRTPVAKDIWCYSPKEKSFTWHVVVNHDSKGYVDKVECKTSHTVHKYKKQNKPASAPRKTAASKSAAKAAEASANLEEIWFEGVKAWGNKVVPNYSPQNFYTNKEVIEHSTFGKGVVQLRRENKIDTLFKTGIKTLFSPDKKA
jgi:hypothetical protein